jgi:hypothetical protein
VNRIDGYKRRRFDRWSPPSIPGDESTEHQASGRRAISFSSHEKGHERKDREEHEIDRSRKRAATSEVAADGEATQLEDEREFRDEQSFPFGPDARKPRTSKE